MRCQGSAHNRRLGASRGSSVATAFGPRYRHSLHAQLRRLRNRADEMDGQTPWLTGGSPPFARCGLGPRRVEVAGRTTLVGVACVRARGGAGSPGRRGGERSRRRARRLRGGSPVARSALVELMLSLPPELSFDPQLDRPLARAAARGLIPERVRLSEDKPIFNRLLDDALTKTDSAELAHLLGDLPEAIAWALDPRGLAEIHGPARSLVTWRAATSALWTRVQFR